MRRVSRWIPAISIASIIWWSSSVPGTDMPPSDFNWLAHFVVYGLLAATIHFALSRDHDAEATWILAILLASVYGVIDEIHQSFVPGRMSDIVDWGWDTLGAAVGASAAHKSGSRRARRATGPTADG